MGTAPAKKQTSVKSKMATRKLVAKKQAQMAANHDGALAKRLQKLENRVSNDEVRIEKVAKQKPVFEDDWEDVPKKTKAKETTTKSFSGHSIGSHNTSITVTPSAGGPNPDMLRLYKQIYPRLPECVRNYIRLLCHPMQRPTFSWCSLLGDTAKVTQNTEYGKATSISDAYGRAAIAICPYALWNDTNCVGVTGLLGTNLLDPINTSDPALFSYFTCSSNPYPRAIGDYSVTEEPAHVRPVIAAICVSSADTALNTKGIVYSYCNPSGNLSERFSMGQLRSSSNTPAGIFQLGNCYPYVWTPPNEEYAQFMDDEQPPAGATRIRPNIAQTIYNPLGTVNGATCILFVEGTAPGTSIFFEWALHYEVSPSLRVNQIPGNLKISESNPKVGGLINSAVNAGQQQRVTSTPEKGLFDRFIDGLESLGSTVADIGGKFLGATAGEFTKTLLA